MSVPPSAVTFTSAGIPCAADLYRPDDAATPVPCVVLGHGFSGTKGLARVYAEQFAAAGLAVLVFDYRHFGESGGEPRQIVAVGKQREDYHAAVRCARGIPGINPERIVLWGTSLSGGHVIAVAAEDQHIAAVIAQVPFIDARRTGRTSRQRLRRALTRGALKLIVSAGRDSLRAVRGQPPYLVRVVGNAGEAAVFSDPAARATFAALGGEAAGWRNAFAPRFILSLPRYPSGTAERLVMPLLVCVADRDLEASPALAIEVAQRAPHGDVQRYPVGHFDVYLEPLRTRVIADQIVFLRQHLYGFGT